MPDLFRYKETTKAKLLFHVEPYAEALNAMARKLQKVQRQNVAYQRRLEEQARIRRFLHQ